MSFMFKIKMFDVNIKNYPPAQLQVVYQNSRIVFNLYLEVEKGILDAILIIEPLDSVQVYKNGFEQNKFRKSDFHQERFETCTKGQGLGHLIHDYIIDNKSKVIPNVDNIYSTNSEIDSKRHQDLKISPSAIKFWEKRIELGKAKYEEQIGRYSILW